MTLAVIDASDVLDLAAAWAHAPDLVARELSVTITEATMLLQREVKEATPTGATSSLRESIHAERPVVLGERVLGIVGTSIAHAVPVELGTKPHFPPIEPLMDWVRAKLDIKDDGTARVYYVALAIARKIAARGTEGAFMFRRAFEDHQRQIRGMYDHAAQRITERLRG